MLWSCPNKSEESVHGDCTVSSVRMKRNMAKKIGTATGREINPEIHNPQNAQQIQTFDVPDRYSEQIRLRKGWDIKMECLNEKYGLDYYSSSDSNSDFEPKQRYETLN